jgi:hypothetical protein
MSQVLGFLGYLFAINQIFGHRQRCDLIDFLQLDVLLNTLYYVS